MTVDGLDKSTWTPSIWNAYVERQPTEEARQAALEEVPEQWRKRVDHHVQVVLSIRKYWKDRAAQRGLSNGG